MVEKINSPVIEALKQKLREKIRFYVEELDREERYLDGSIIRFQYHDWPINEKLKIRRENNVKK